MKPEVNMKIKKFLSDFDMLILEAENINKTKNNEEQLNIKLKITK